MPMPAPWLSRLFRRSQSPARPAVRLTAEPLEAREVPSVAFDGVFGFRATPNAVAADAAGNLYVAGVFRGKDVDFDPGAAAPDGSDVISSHTFVNSSGGVQYAEDGFVAKYAPDGRLAWVRGIDTGVANSNSAPMAPGGPAPTLAALAVDASGGVFVAGSYTGALKAAAGVLLGSSAGEDVYVAKLGADGSWQWAVRNGGAGADQAYDLALDAAGNPYLSGNSRTGTGPFEMTVSKFDGGTGALAWDRRVAAAEQSWATGLAVDPTGAVYMTGTFRATVDFDPGPGTYKLNGGGQGYRNTFVLKLTGTGAFAWARNVENGGSFTSGNDIAVDAAGNAYVTGRFSGQADFDPGKGKLLLTSAGSDDAYVWKLTAAGNVAWARQIGGVGFDEGRSIALDGAGGVYVAGQFAGTADFDPGAAKTALTSAGDYDAFVTKLTASGGYEWAAAAGGAGWDQANGIVVDTSGTVSVVGRCVGPADFDPTAAYLDDRDRLTAGGGFVWKLRQR